MEKLPQLECRKCGVKNPVSYFASVAYMNKQGVYEGTCFCHACAEKRNILDNDGNLKKGIEL